MFRVNQVPPSVRANVLDPIHVKPVAVPLSKGRGKLSLHGCQLGCWGSQLRGGLLLAASGASHLVGGKDGL
jgi:hypothetical protein